MNLKSLGYVGIASQKAEDWADFARNLLGMQVIDRGAKSLALRMDDRKQRLFVDADNHQHYFGWEVEDAAAFAALATHLEANDIVVVREPQSLADRRCVAELMSFSDPVGNRLEVFHGAALADEAFKPSRCISGFRTGPLGVGHVVLTTDNIDRILPFYSDVLGFRLSDYTLKPFKAYFMHINARHHSFAVVETGRNGFHHLMVELFSLDDVGQAYDLAQGEDERVAVTLGRHTNDLITSFYAKSPSDFMFEYGWGGRDIDLGSWTPFECDYGPSLWGHERSWLTPERRAEARALRIKAAETGHREPVQVLAGNYQTLAGHCPWWDSLPRR